jgi:hypothetical protein
MAEREMGYADLAVILGISEPAAYRRLRGFAEWKLPEIIKLCHFFDISDMDWLFKRL